MRFVGLMTCAFAPAERLYTNLESPIRLFPYLWHWGGHSGLGLRTLFFVKKGEKVRRLILLFVSQWRHKNHTRLIAKREWENSWQYLTVRVSSIVASQKVSIRPANPLVLANLVTVLSTRGPVSWTSYPIGHANETWSLRTISTQQESEYCWV